MKIDLNDITTSREENTELDLNSFFWVWKIKLDEILFWRNIDNLKRDFKKYLMVKKKPIIEINPNIVNVETIKINKNLKKDIDLKWKWEFKKDIFTLDYEDIEETREINKKHFDFFVKRIYNFKYFKKLFSSFLNKIDKSIMWFPKKYYVVTLSLLIFIVFLFWYKFILENTLLNGYKNINNLLIKWDKSKKIESEIKNISFNFWFSSILFKPIELINKLTKSEKINNVWYLIDGWKYLSNVLKSWIDLKENILEFIEKKDVWDIYFTNLIRNIKLKKFLENSNQSLNQALTEYYEIDDLGDSSNNEKFLRARKKLFSSKKKIELFIKNYYNLLELLWDKKLKKYLVVFQNNDEIRPTWGFMGSMWIVSIFKWKVEKFEKKDVYAYEWEINKDPFREAAPKWLNKITKTFGLRDANYFVEVERSSNKIKYFLKKAWEDIDWIIYLNQNFLLDFLDVLDWVQFDKINKHIDSENFSIVMSSLVEAKKFKLWAQWSPKQILFDFMEIFVEKLKKNWEYEKYLSVIFRNIENRDLMIYSFDDNKFLSDMSLNWKINYKETIDFNYPIFTSISGNKSDRYIKRTYKKKYEIGNNCDILTKFEINLEHTFTKEEKENVMNILKQFEIDKLPNHKNLLNIQWNGVNHSYVRVLIPRNSIINTKIHSVKTYKDKYYKQVDFYLKTPIWWKSHRYMEYIIKNPECKKYSYKIYKQPWIREYNVEFFNNDYSSEVYGDWEFME